MLTTLQIVAAIFVFFMAIVVQRKISRTYSHSVSILLIGLVTGTVLIGAGILGRLAVWLILTRGFFNMWINMSRFIAEGALSFIGHVMWVGLFPGSVTALVSATGGSWGDKVIRGCAAATIALIMQETAVQILEVKGDTSWIIFSICGGFIIGSIAGLVMGLFNEKLLQTIGMSDQRYSLSYVSQKLTKSRTFRVFAFVSVGALVYFSFYYRVPTRVFLRLVEWDEISFAYAMPRARMHYPRKHEEPKMGIDVAAARFVSEAVRDTLDILLSFDPWARSGEPKTATSVEIVTAEEGITLQDLTQLRGGRSRHTIVKTETIYKDSIPRGRIRVVQPDDLGSVFFEDSPPQWRNMLLFIPYGQRIRLSRDPRDFFAFRAHAMSETSGVQEVPLDLKTDGSALTTITWTKSRLALVFHNGISVRTDSSESRLRLHPRQSEEFERSEVDFYIELPGERNPIRIEPKELILKTTPDTSLEYEYPAVILLIGDGQGGDVLEFDSFMKNVEFQRCNFWVEDRWSTSPPLVSDFFARGTRGKLQVLLDSYPLSFGDEILIGGEELRMAYGPNGEISIQGRSSRVILNGVNLADTAWSSLPAEVRGAIIGSFFATVGAWLVWLLSKRSKRESDRAP